MTPAGGGSPSVSVCVVSRGRPLELTRCLTGLFQLRYDPFEVVVVADPAGLDAARPWAGRIKTAAFDVPNISVARNLALELAAGEVVAFIDDDAVPEPSWLTHLVAPIAAGAAEASGGHVRGRNGISFQWRTQWVDGSGVSHPLEVPDDRWSVPALPPGRALHTQGTNMAVRRETLVRLGGFDPRFRFFLDETDLNLRISASGRRIAAAPLAEVHHGFAAGPYRRADRVPRDLHEIGASLAVFHGKHGAPPDAWPIAMAAQRARLLRHLQTGACEPRDVGRLMASLHAGHTEGRTREETSPPPPEAAIAPFRAVPSTGRTGPSRVLAGRPVQARALRDRAREMVAQGDVVTLMIFEFTLRNHTSRFRVDGYWEQTGGLYGRSDRDVPRKGGICFRDRVAEEGARIQIQRLVED